MYSTTLRTHPNYHNVIQSFSLFLLVLFIKIFLRFRAVFTFRPIYGLMAGAWIQLMFKATVNGLTKYEQRMMGKC